LDGAAGSAVSDDESATSVSGGCFTVESVSPTGDDGPIAAISSSCIIARVDGYKEAVPGILLAVYDRSIYLKMFPT